MGVGEEKEKRSRGSSRAFGFKVFRKGSWGHGVDLGGPIRGRGGGGYVAVEREKEAADLGTNN